MPVRDMALAALTSVVCGLAFIATKLALDSFSAAQLTALRFIIACLPVLIVKRPPIARRCSVNSAHPSSDRRGNPGERCRRR
jgi:drug/metabolite transporter (DMT)-like permease